LRLMPFGCGSAALGAFILDSCSFYGMARPHEAQDCALIDIGRPR